MLKLLRWFWPLPQPQGWQPVMTLTLALAGGAVARTGLPAQAPSRSTAARRGRVRKRLMSVFAR